MVFQFLYASLPESRSAEAEQLVPSKNMLSTLIF